jgi:hypothetical protein
MSVHFPDANEAELIRRVATRVGMTPSAWIRSVALGQANILAGDGWDVTKMKARVVELKKLKDLEKPTATVKKPALKVIRGGKR